MLMTDQPQKPEPLKGIGNQQRRRERRMEYRRRKRRKALAENPLHATEEKYPDRLLAKGEVCEILGLSLKWFDRSGVGEQLPPIYIYPGARPKWRLSDVMEFISRK